MINIDKNKKKVPFMISTVKSVANEFKMGKLVTMARIKLIETIVIPTIIYGSEAYPNVTKMEEKELEKIQGKIIRESLGVPQTTPYAALLMETGMLTMEA